MNETRESGIWGMSTRAGVQLSEKERAHLKGMLRRGAAPARVQTRARVLLLSDRSRGERRTDGQVAAAVLTSVSTAKRTRWRFLQEGLEAALAEKPRPGLPPKITGVLSALNTVLAEKGIVKEGAALSAAREAYAA